MLDHLKKLKIGSKGFDVNPMKAVKKPKIKDGCFDPNDQKNWLFEDDPGYQKTRKSKKKKKKK